MGRAIKKILHLFRRRHFEAALEEELRFHRAMIEHKDGHPADFGNATLASEDSRAEWSFRRLETILQDVRYAMRGFLRQPAFALTVVGTIGLALGLNTTLFTVFNAYVLRPLAVRDPQSLYEMRWEFKRGGTRWFAQDEYRALVRDTTAFSETLVFANTFARVNSFPMFGNAVSNNYFEMLGAEPTLGRTLLPGDESVAVVSYSAWRNKLGADPEIIGRRIAIRGVLLEVIGITRPEFTGVGQVPPDFWVPLSMAARMDPAGSTNATLIVVGRLRPGLSVRQAQTQLGAWAHHVTADGPENRRVLAVTLEPRGTMIPWNQEMAAVFAPVLAAFVLVLLIACANVANMMLARALAREREIGIRLSLGAARGRLIRQLLTESLLLAFPAALAGLAISSLAVRLGTELMWATLPPEFARLINVIGLEPDWRVFGFILLAAAGATLAFGLAPALQATRRGLIQSSRADFSADLRPARLRNALVIGQVTVCALLLITSGVLLRTGRAISARDVRMNTTGVLDLITPAKFQEKVAETLQSEPWVESIAAGFRTPLYGPMFSMTATPSGARERVRVAFNFVSPDYFNVLRIPLARGRTFTREEAAAEAQVAIVSEATAAKLWPGRDALEQSLNIDGITGDKPAKAAQAQIVGVARDVISGWVGDGLDTSMVYLPTRAGAAGNRSLLVRVKGEGDAMRRKVDQTLERALLMGAVDQVNPMDQVLAVQIYPFRIAGWISSMLAGLALVLTVSGIYGVMSYLVSQRTKEIGIRMAMGASASGILRFVLAHSLRLALVGLAMGAAMAWGACALFASQLTMIDFFDKMAFAGGGCLVLIAALAASFFPSRRAVQVDPVSALRAD